jgi:polysaccharide biosynthesis protein PelG
VAGIGFALRRNLQSESYVGLLRAYAVAAVVGSGPWLISMGSLLFIGLYTQHVGRGTEVVTQFLGAVTHLMALSLIVAGLLQLVLVRYVADRLFDQRTTDVFPNLVGAMAALTVLGGAVAGVESLSFLPAAGSVKALYIAAFVALCNVWLLAALMSGLKRYLGVLLVFALGYLAIVGLAGRLARFGLPGYLLAFVLGQGAMVVGMLALVRREYPSPRRIAFQFLSRGAAHYDLAAIGALFNIAVWADKFVFWTNPVTSVQLIGPVRYSIVYDVPIFVSYLSVVPGVAVFFVRIEADFAAAYDRYFSAVRQGETLDELRRLRDELVVSARAGLYDILRVHGTTVAVLLLLGTPLIGLFGIPPLYSYLFKIDVVAVGFQTFLLGVFTVLFYLDYRRLVLWLCALFAVSNLGLSLLSQALGPRFYGFGFAVSTGLTAALSLKALSHRLDRLEYETFMR